MEAGDIPELAGAGIDEVGADTLIVAFGTRLPQNAAVVDLIVVL